MIEENPKSDLEISLKKGKLPPKKKIYSDNLEKPLDLDNLLKKEEPVFVKMKENLTDKITKFSALAAVLLAFFTVMFDCSQSIKQDKTFTSFQQKLESTFNTQLENSKKQHEKTIETLVTQQDLMKVQNDSTVKLLKTQADRLKVQNEIWKIDQKNKIQTERVKISSSITDYYLKNDTIKLKFNYSNKGQRDARNINCEIAIFIMKGKFVLPLLNEKAPLSMNKIVPDGTVYWSINKDFIGLIAEDQVYIYSSLTYEDEMYQNIFTTSEFVRIFNKDKKTEYSYCSQSEIDLIEKTTKFKNIELEDFTIKHEFHFE